MNGERERRIVRLPGAAPVVKLACTTCQHVYERDLAHFQTGDTGCPRCGGWTWIAQLGSAEWSAVPSNDQAAPQQQAFDSVCPDPAVTPPRTAAGPGSPTTRK
jgi:hypothetical protein